MNPGRCTGEGRTRNEGDEWKTEKCGDRMRALRSLAGDGRESPGRECGCGQEGRHSHMHRAPHSNQNFPINGKIVVCTLSGVVMIHLFR